MAKKEKQQKNFRVGFVGAKYSETIKALTEKEAKRKFADKHNIGVSNYIVIKRK